MDIPIPSLLQNLTEFNTAHNRRITALGDIADVPTNPLKRKRKNSHVGFNDEEEIINPGEFLYWWYWQLSSILNSHRNVCDNDHKIEAEEMSPSYISSTMGDLLQAT